MDQRSLDLPEGPLSRRGDGAENPARLGSRGGRLGRPPGGSKRALDLAKYIEATFGGMTPGQQAAQLGLVTPGEVARAKKDAKDLGMIDHGLSGVALAMAVKSKKLALALSCDPRDAFLLMQKERGELMAYVHQKQAPKADTGGAKPVATVFVIPEGQDTGQNHGEVQDDGGIDFAQLSGPDQA